MKPLCSVLLAFTLILTACMNHVSQTTIIVLDTSMSITPRAERAALDAIHEQILRLGRGDRLILVPITEDAENDTGGRILRLTAPAVREPYDTDSKRFQADAERAFTSWRASLDNHQTKTDILSTLDIVRQEFDATPANATKQLIIASDFLEDEPCCRFVNAPQLANEVRACRYASQLRTERGFVRVGVRVSLGRLESTEFATLSPQRKQAVQAFWIEYLSDHGQKPDMRFDGLGLLAEKRY